MKKSKTSFSCISLAVIFLLLNLYASAQDRSNKNNKTITLETGEKWWGGDVFDGDKAPFGNFDYTINLYGDNKSNQSQPLLISNYGRYVWSEKPFEFSFQKNNLIISDNYGLIESGKAGNNLADVYKFVSNKFFKASKKLPDTLLFATPQWNTWIELTYNQNQHDILNYAHNIIANGFSPGVLMIDDTWQQDYGVWEFNAARFPNPKAMMDSLHRMGFKVMVWVCPFVSGDSPPYRKLKSMNALVREAIDTTHQSWNNETNEPAMIRWWNGASAVLDLTNDSAVAWFKAQLKNLQNNYGVDGFKFDAGDAYFYPVKTLSTKKVLPNEQSELFGKIGLNFPLNEYRAMWKMAGEPLAERLQDKSHSWEDLQKLIPQILAQGLMGYAFTCPDTIGGGEYGSFLNNSTINQDLMVRSAQVHALMAMMQFSVAPWRILDSTHLAAVKKAVAIRAQFTPLIMQLAKQAAQTNMPVIRHLEFVFSDENFSEVKDEFMLGDSLLVAPVINNTFKREVALPKGKWRSDDNKIYEGGHKIMIDVPLNRLPYFFRLK